MTDDQVVTPEQVLAKVLADACEHFQDRNHPISDILAALAERGYRVSKDGDCIEATLEVTEDDLSTAWAAAEAALPYKRGGIELTMFNRNDGPYSVAVADSWPAGGETVHVEASGPTPTAALLNLAAQLSQAGRKEPKE